MTNSYLTYAQRIKSFYFPGMLSPSPPSGAGTQAAVPTSVSQPTQPDANVVYRWASEQRILELADFHALLANEDGIDVGHITEIGVDYLCIRPGLANSTSSKNECIVPLSMVRFNTTPMFFE